MNLNKRILIVSTSHDKLGDTGRQTGFHYEELATPYWAFIDIGNEVDIASIKGGEAPADPNSIKAIGENPTSVDRFLQDSAAMDKISNTTIIDDVDPKDYDAIYLPGGHGTMFDLPKSSKLADVIGHAFDNGAVIGAICHGPAGLLNAKTKDGKPIISGRNVGCFSNSEEEAISLTDVMPFLLETKMKKLGGNYSSGGQWQTHAIRDGNLVTGQNPQSAERAAELMIEALIDT